MRKVLLATILAIGQAVSLAAANASERDTCDTVLLQRTVVSTTTSKRAQLAWLKLVTEGNYDEARKGGSALVPGYFDGSYQQFDAKRNERLQKEGYHSDTEEAAQELRVELPPGAVPSWRDCIALHGEGLFFWIEDVSDNGAALTLSWNPAQGLGDLTAVSITTKEGVGTVEPNFSTVEALHHGDKRFILTRSPSTAAMRGIVNGQAGNPPGLYSAKFYIPALIPPEPKPDTKLCLVIFDSSKTNPKNKIMEFPAITGNLTEDCAIKGSQLGATDVLLGCRNAQGGERWAESQFAVKIPSKGEGEGRADQQLSAAGPKYGLPSDQNCGWQ